MPGENIVALDIGTTGVKAILVDRDGQALASGYAGHPTYSRGAVVEQDPRDWWEGTLSALTQLWQAVSTEARHGIAAVALSGQMQDLIPLGADDALGRAILYSDSRAPIEAAQVIDAVGADELERITGNAQGASGLLAKWRWLQLHDPERLAACRTLLIGAHDYVARRLCGAAVSDYTTATTTGLFDLLANDWAYGLLERLGLDAAQLPRLVAAEAVVGQVDPAAAAVTGLPAGTPVFHGAGDLAATTVGVGAGEPGRLYGYLGTSGWIATSLWQATPNPAAGVFTLRHPDPVRFIQVAPMLTAGGNLAWMREQIGGARDFAVLNDMAAAAPPGSGGLLYLPYLAGERSPFTDPNARACFIGLSSDTSPADMVRAVMEGIAFAYRSLRDALGVHAAPGEQGALYLVGGGARSPLWPQILADVLSCSVYVPASPGDAAARGAAVLAGKGLGWYVGYAPGTGFFPVERTYAPNTANVPVYDALYDVFHELYPRLRNPFGALASVRNRDRKE